MTASTRRDLRAAALALGLAAFLVLGAAYAKAGLYGLHAFWLRGGAVWQPVGAGSPSLSPAMRAALQDHPPAQPGPFAWQDRATGFQTAELPVLSGGAEVDRILLARVDPRRFQLVARNAPAGRMLEDWMADPGTVLVVNGSYYGTDGTPDTPFVSGGVALGPARYDATHGAFVASDGFTGIRDLAGGDWHAALAGARDAMVSYPLLLAADGSSRAGHSRWLSNRSFVAQDAEGWVVVGTTREAFFPLDGLAAFLRAAPLLLTLALNLDGGPVACQGIALDGFRRAFCGQWETQEHGGTLSLLTYRWGRPDHRTALPVVLAAVRRP